MTPSEKNELVRACNESRNLCGSYSNAIAQWEEDNRKLSPEERFEVIQAAGEQWRQWSAEARLAAR